MPDIAAFVRAAPAVDGIRLAGVDGPSGAGKSTLAGELASALDAPIIEIDDFVSWDHFADWWPRFETQVLNRLRSGADAVYQARDWASPATPAIPTRPAGGSAGWTRSRRSSPSTAPAPAPTS